MKKQKPSPLKITVLLILTIICLLALSVILIPHKPRYTCGTPFYEANFAKGTKSKEDTTNIFEYVWLEEPDSISHVSNSVRHYCNMVPHDGWFKTFNSKGNQNFYYNDRHGYYVLLPSRMGYNQSGENIMGAHSNEFYNEDTTLVISCFALFYDVLLYDHPYYADTLRDEHVKYLKDIGEVQYIIKKKNNIVAKVKVNKDNPDNPTSDYLISKWILKKDIDNRECEMDVNIWYNDSLKRKEKEFYKILNTFPNNPFQ